MRIDGRDITVAGSLLQPLTRRTNDILRLVSAAAFLAVVIASSLFTRYEWATLEQSLSQLVKVLTPAQSNLVYILYGVAILALPFVMLINLVFSRQWIVLGASAAAGLFAILALSITGSGISAPRWHIYLTEKLNTVLSQFLDDPRWIAMLAAVLTVAGPWASARWRRWWWTLLLAFVPIHLVVSAVVPARSLLGLAVGWFVGALVVLAVGTPALEVPLDGAVRALGGRGIAVTALHGHPARRARTAGAVGGRCIGDHRDVRTEPAQPQRHSATLAQAAAAGGRNRSPATVDAARCRTPRA